MIFNRKPISTRGRRGKRGVAWRGVKPATRCCSQSGRPGVPLLIVRDTRRGTDAALCHRGPNAFGLPLRYRRHLRLCVPTRGGNHEPSCHLIHRVSIHLRRNQQANIAAPPSPKASEFAIQINPLLRPVIPHRLRHLPTARRVRIMIPRLSRGLKAASRVFFPQE